jgi:hypothetical protein
MTTRSLAEWFDSTQRTTELETRFDSTP